jgi:YjbE family integral membrane protein
MTEWITPQFWVAVTEIILVNILLSGDNAMVIALACRNLSNRARRHGIFWGVLGAIGLRIALTLFAMTLLTDPYLKLVGGALLVWIGIKLIAQDDAGEHRVEASDRLVTAVWTIIVADLVMSFDNVMAVAAAAKGHVGLMVFGLVVSIPIVVVGARLIMRLMERYPLLVLVGGGLLGYIAGEMIVDDIAVRPFLGANAAMASTVIPIVGFGLVVGIGVLLARRRRRAEGA